MDRQTVPVRVTYYGNAAYSDLSPLLDELQTTAYDVDAKIRLPRPEDYGKGGPFPVTLEMAFDFAKAGGAIYAARFIAELGKDHYQLLRQKIVEMRRKSAGAETVERNFPLSIMFGTTQFYIDTPITEKEFSDALLAAASLVKSMPDERLNNPSGASGWPITWDASAKTWRDAIG
jgi:hypothetical protein